MPHPSPTVVLPLDPPITVEFSFVLLERIEETTGKTLNDLALTDLAALAIDIPDGQKPTREQAIEAMKRVRLTTITTFVAACLQVPRAQLGDLVPQAKLAEVFSLLAGEFVKALSAINGVAEAETPADPPAPALPASP